ncbi:hypothetical protein IV203_037374 [Nitzschia inconspicua]|uniref:Uncharacterized protein n=1 Tax=Nitzschia inconspicua TaxID=303405 RepID=A0A9K3LLB7_9STRA|nr:hypothetical protein IV203_037374 [Nitzschia inconspicua]
MNPSSSLISLCSGAVSDGKGFRRLLLESPNSEARIQTSRFLGDGDMGQHPKAMNEASSLSRCAFGVKAIDFGNDPRSCKSRDGFFSKEIRGGGPVTTNPTIEKPSLFFPTRKSILGRNGLKSKSHLSVLGGGFPMPRLHKDILSPYSSEPPSDSLGKPDVSSTSTFVQLALKLANKGSQNTATSLVLEKDPHTVHLVSSTPRFSSFPLPTLTKVKRNRKRKPYCLQSYKRIWESINVKASTNTASFDGFKDSIFVKQELFRRRVHQVKRL